MNVGRSIEPDDTQNVPASIEGLKEANPSCEAEEGETGTNQNHTPNTLPRKSKMNMKSVKTIFFENQSLSFKF